MSFQSKIEELKNQSIVLKTDTILEWLKKNEDDFHDSIRKSNCRKWDKWLNNNEKPFPCVCSYKEQDCVFIELYYELDKIIKQEYSSSIKFITSDLIQLVLITQNEPYKKTKFLIQINKQ